MESLPSLKFVYQDRSISQLSIGSRTTGGSDTVPSGRRTGLLFTSPLWLLWQPNHTRQAAPTFLAGPPAFLHDQICSSSQAFPSSLSHSELVHLCLAFTETTGETAENVGLGLDAYDKDMRARKYRHQLNAWKKHAMNAGFPCTPAFFVDGRTFETQPDPFELDARSQVEIDRNKDKYTVVEKPNPRSML